MLVNGFICDYGTKNGAVYLVLKTAKRTKAGATQRIRIGRLSESIAETEMLERFKQDVLNGAVIKKDQKNKTINKGVYKKGNFYLEKLCDCEKCKGSNLSSATKNSIQPEIKPEIKEPKVTVQTEIRNEIIFNPFEGEKFKNKKVIASNFFDFSVKAIGYLDEIDYDKSCPFKVRYDNRFAYFTFLKEAPKEPVVVPYKLAEMGSTLLGKCFKSKDGTQFSVVNNVMLKDGTWRVNGMSATEFLNTCLWLGRMTEQYYDEKGVRKGMPFKECHLAKSKKIDGKRKCYGLHDFRTGDYTRQCLHCLFFKGV